MPDIVFDSQEELDLPDRGVNDTPCFTISDNDLNKFIDNLNNAPSDRRIPTLRYADRYYNLTGKEKEVYSHRKKYSKYHMRIGDCCFQIPPEYISVKETSNTVRVPGVRKKSTLKKKHGYSTTDISFDLYFNGDEQINGFEVDSPFNYKYYVDGLRPFLAQCKVSPIMPVENEHLNKTCGIYCIVIQSVTVSTVPGFPKLLKANVIATECNQSVYTMCPNFMFSDLIEWDLYKYNYQRLLNNVSYDSIPDNAKFKPVKNFSIGSDLAISIMDDNVFTTNDIEEIRKNSKIDLNKIKFKEVLNSEKDEFIVQQVNFGYSNIVVNCQLSDHSKPATQYLGGNDTVISLQLTTTDSDVASKFKSLITNTQAIIRKIKECNGIGFVKMDNSFLQMLGTSHLLIDSVSVDTVPSFPGQYIINMECVSYDTIGLDEENVEGFRPFVNDSKGTKEDCISQNVVGLYNKIYQDVMAEYKIAQANLYPDLMLPSYKEVDNAVTKISAYRRKLGLPELPYSSYPRTVSKDFILGVPYVFDTFVEPDYYFVYPMFNFEENKTPIDKIVVSKDVNAGKVDKKYVLTRSESSSDSVTEDGTPSGTDNPIPTTTSATSCTKLGIKATGVTRKYLDYLFSKVGCGYLLGAIGQIMTEQTIASLKWAGGRVRRDLWMGKEIYDCSGIIGWAMYKCGYYSTVQQGRIYHLDIYNKHCTKISKADLQPGDVVFSATHVATYIGGGKTVEAANPDKGVVIGELSWGKYYCYGRIKWPQRLIDQHKNYDVKTYSNSTSAGTSVIDQTINNFNSSLRTVQSNTDLFMQSRTPILGTTDINGNPTGTGGLTSNTAPGGSLGSSSSSSSAITGNKTIKLGSLGGNFDKFDSLIQYHSRKYGFNPNWIKALMRQESAMNPNVGPNHVGAVGLMQITKAPCGQRGVAYNISKLKEPEYNIDMGCWYLNWLRKTYGWTDGKALCMAYNGGAGNYQKYLRTGTGPSEMINHGAKCLGFYNTLIANGGEAKSYSPEGDNAVLGDITIDNYTKPSDWWTGVKELFKKHGERKEQFNLEMGYPLTSYSPVNVLYSKHRLEKDGKGNVKVAELYQVANKKSTLSKQLSEKELNIIKKYNTSFAKNNSLNVDGAATVDYDKAVDDFLDKDNNYYLSTMTVNDVQYNKRGTMLKAFPTYCVVISDDNSTWYDGRKLWSNYYPYKSMVSLSVFHEEEQPVGTAKIQLTNLSQNLSKVPTREAYKKSLKNDPEHGLINVILYNEFGFILGSPKITQGMVDAKNELVSAMKIRPGTRIHIRMGYGSNPLSLNVSFNGTVAEVSTGEILEMIAQNDGAETINQVVSVKENKTNGLALLKSEPSNMITSLLIDRSSWLNLFNSKWGENNEYGIEHFGLYLGNGLTTSKREREYDLCKNIYIGKYEKALYCSNNTIFDGETNINMFLYNKTPWDVSQTVNSCLPEFLCQPRYHQFDTRMFFGLPTWLYKYRYDLTPSGAVLEQAKTFQQLHILDGDDILDNKLKCTGKFLSTNVVCMYTLGEDMKQTPTLFSDKNIDWSKQKTKVIDSILQQDFFGPDGFYELLGFDNGRTNAISTGISNLIDSYSKIYYDDIVCLGKPGVFPCDQIFINDRYAEMYGLAKVRAVTHSLSPETGFISTISPSLIAYSKTQDSGSANTYRTAANLGDLVCNILNARREVCDVFNVMSDTVYDAISTNHTELLDYIRRCINLLTPCTDSAWTKDILNMIEEKRNRENSNKYCSLLSSICKAPPFFILPSIVNAAIHQSSIIFRTPLIRDVVDWFRYSNCIGVRPLIYRQYPFITGVKGQKRLMEGYDESPYYEDNDD